MTDRYLSKLSPRHQQIVRLFVAGNSQSDIARLLKINKSTVSRNLKDPLLIEEIKKLQEMADVSSVACVSGIPEKIQEGCAYERKGFDRDSGGQKG